MYNLDIKKFLLGIWTVLLLLFRPSFLGERFNPLVFLLFLLVTILISLIAYRKIKLLINNNLFLTFSLIVVLILYFLVQGMLLSEAKKTVINSTSVILGVSICILLISRKENIQTIVKTFINIHVLLGLSSIITILIFIIKGLDIQNIPVMANMNKIMGQSQEEYDIYSNNRLLFFPFSLSWA